jgi:hypothetical protein
MANPAAPRKNSEQAVIPLPKEELRKRIEHDPQLRKDFDLLIAVTGLQPNQLLTGLCLDCNLMKADRQTLIRNEIQELWPIREDSLRRTITHIRRIAREMEDVTNAKFSLAPVNNPMDNFAGLPQTLRSYATELERLVDRWAIDWKRTKSRIPRLVALTRRHSLYERIRSSAGKYHQNRLLRLVNEARVVNAYPKIDPRAFTVWLNRLEKRRKQSEATKLS